MDKCPIINLTVKVWTFWSFICVHNSFRYFVIPVIVQNMFQFMDLYHAWGNIEDVIMNMYFTILYFNAVVSFLDYNKWINQLFSKCISAQNNSFDQESCSF